MDTFIYFDKFSILFYGAIAGFIFGFLLRKAHVSRFNTIVGQLLFKDFTVLKVILSAIVVGSIGIYGMLSLGLIEKLQISASSILATGIGGLVFGVGMAVMGYCPGTGIAALADGSRDMIFGTLGMVVGAVLFELCYPLFKHLINTPDVISEKSIATLAHISPWMVIIGILFVSLGLFAFLEKKMPVMSNQSVK